MLLHKNNNFIGLFIGQLILIFTTPFLHYFDDVISGLILHIAFISMILITVMGNKANKLWYKSILVLAAIELLLFVFSVIYNNVFLTLGAMSLSLFFLVSSISVALVSVFSSRDISVNQLVGASCIYLLLGSIWAILYSNVYFISNDAFQGIPERETQLHFSEFVYYSFVTLTTLGFGDITPVSPFAKTLSFMQAVTGQLYLTIMVAGLVGKAINSSKLKH